jgi:hypothetical protein
MPEAAPSEFSIPHSEFLMGRTLIILGLVIAAVGLLMSWGAPIGRLPGDFHVRRGNFSFYFPLATSIIASIVLTLLLWALRR